MRTKKIFFLLVLSLGSIARLSAQDIIPRISLLRLLDSAVQNNYLLKSNEKNKMIKQKEIEILAINYLPKISTSASFSYWSWIMPNKQKMLGDSKTDLYTDISVSQTIYDWGENKIKKTVVEDEILLNDELNRQIRNTIVWGVTDAYFEILKAESEVSVHFNSIHQLKSHLQYADNLYKIGKVSVVDLLKINLQISVEEKALQKAQNSVLGEYIKIKRLCNLDENKKIEIEDFSDILYNEFQNRIFSSDSLYNEILKNHPTLQSSDIKVNMESKQKEIFRLQSKPELFSYGIASWEHGYIPFGANFNYNIGVGIRYTLPFLGGKGYKTRMLQSDLRIEQMKDEKNQAFLNIQKEIDILLNEINDKRSEITNNEKIIRLTQETLNNTLVKYQSGQGPIIDVLDAQSILTETTIAHRKSTFAYLQSLGKLNYITGNDKYPF